MIRDGRVSSGARLRRAMRSCIQVSTFYVFREDLCLIQHVEPPSLPGLQVVPLTKADTDELLNMPGRDKTRSVLEARFRRGDLCIGVRSKGELCGFSWALLDWLYFGCYRMPLEHNEGYLFDLYTLPSLRGRGLAGHIRYELIKVLHAQGRQRIFSLCLRDNKPALRFREKLGVLQVDQGITIKLFRRWRIGTKARPEKLRSAPTLP